ncbi:MAG TPA: STAS domain-containing protein [Tepidisphaeraceae bacterium]|jgi:anti-anti-sigma factor|nr:STAS domain-containing protein [Tepidisphaeraceae bacterium]
MDLKTAGDLVSSARTEGDALVIAVRGEIDLHNSSDLRTEIMDLIGKQSPKRLILNLEQVPYMDSSACAVLVETLRRMRTLGGKVYLVALQPRVKGLIEIARLGSIFTIAADEKEALG